MKIDRLFTHWSIFHFSRKKYMRMKRAAGVKRTKEGSDSP